MIREDDRFKHLVQQTFRTDAGQALLEELRLTYVRNNFDDNPYRMARNCGQSDLVNLLTETSGDDT